ncbi:MDR family MFS transporter [Flavobacterium hydatis]|jgi:predicted MFS family arabinose efflux permease|uniref:MFS transporter n=1 Tax=Flavobacterium hydatis TaxID=991 RepID=A0A086AAB1_FLAHY|nr:MFS transporter [Flavobacterium hydatis]KFF13625.1 major facilitator transporter [Flavobacterium hydatis]OXA90276.1 MFS transporter [Flavobacterium hydatis]
MLINAFQQYINNFRGFSREIWILTLVTFINRAGTMVLPFLSKYLKEDLQFTYNEVGWIMVSFGLGSMLGSWLGGKLSDKIGFYKIMVFSLFTSGVSLFFLQYITTFWALCFAMFTIMIIADMFRPAMYVSLSAYAKPENRTRALTLVRLAVNLGFAAGPALGGLIIMGIGYQGLFWVDGASCILSITIFALLVKEKKKPVHDSSHDIVSEPKSVFTDKIFWVFLFVSFATAIIFFQLFTTLPLYHKEKFDLTEFQTGLLMTLNGLMIFSLEMSIVSYFERNAFRKIKIIIYGTLLMALSFYLLLINVWAGVLVFAMIIVSLGEILAFPFSNAFALSRAPRGQEGRYMALYTMSFSLAHIISSKLGFEFISRLGYQYNWFIMGTIGLTATACCLWIQKELQKENSIL